jgi:hypothetical protein
MKWCKEDIEQSMKARYPFYIISWTCSLSSLHHFEDLLDILFTSFHGLERISSKSMRWCKDDIEQDHAMMERGYRVSPWNDVKRISSKSMTWCKEDILHHFMDLLDILFTSFHGLLDILFASFHWLARYPLYIISWTCSIFSLHHSMRARP